MKEKIRKILLWLGLIISASYFVGAFIEIAMWNLEIAMWTFFSFSKPSNETLINFFFLIISGYFFIKLQKKLNIPCLFRKLEEISKQLEKLKSTLKRQANNYD